MYADRLDDLPPYLFARIDELKAEQLRRGVDVIDLGVGDPDLPTPPHIVDALCTAARDPANHHYPHTWECRSSVLPWLMVPAPFSVTLDPETQWWP